MNTSTTNRRHIVMFSGGLSSAYAAKLACDEQGANNIILLFTDTLWEDEDTYRFLHEAADCLGAPLEIIAEGRTPEQLFFDEGYLGNDRVPLCSRVLKGEQTLTYVKPGDTLYFGIDWQEYHRARRIEARYAELGIDCEFPLCSPPYLTRDDMRTEIEQEWGLAIPRMYDLGFPHANCGGRCIRGKKGHYAHLFLTWPEVYTRQEDMEQRFRSETGKDVSILRHNGEPYTLKQYRLDVLEPQREQLEAQVGLFDDEIAPGCMCFSWEAAS